jgi:hypothetical protein
VPDRPSLTPLFIDIGQVRGAPSGRERRHVRLGDIDGDGRVDYCLIADNGDITCWRNGGAGRTPTWQDMGIVFTGKNKGNIDGVRFVDINGDVRFEVSENFHTLIMPCSTGMIGSGLEMTGEISKIFSIMLR